MSDSNTAALDVALNTGSEQPQDQQPDQTQEQVPTQEAPKEEIKRLQKLKLKVYGDELEEDLPDFLQVSDNPEAVEYLTKQFQMAKAAQRAMQENTSYKNQVTQFLQSFKSDTKSALLQMGIDPKEFAAAVIEEEIKKSQMSPEQREKEELQAKLKKIEDERKQEKEEAERKELERLQQAEYQKIETQMERALEKTALPKEPYVVKKIAEYMLIGERSGVELTPEDVLPLVEKEIRADIQSLIRALGEDKVEDFIGKDVFNKIRKKNLGKVKQTPGTVKAAIKDTGKTGKSDSAPSEKKTLKDIFGKI